MHTVTFFPNEVIVFDTNTGTMKFNIPVPMGVYQNNSKPSLISVPTIFPDGNAYYPMVTRNDVLSNPDPNHGQYSISESLNLLSVSPSGTTQTIHLIDNSCTSLRTDGYYYFDCYEISPNEVVPTNEGGKIITWGEYRGGSFCNPTACPTTTNNHFVTLPQGGTPTDHVLTSVQTSDNALGTVTVGENGVLYQALPAAVVAANYNTGQLLWNYDASATGQPSLKLSAVTDTGANELLVMEQQAHVLPASYYSLFTLDASGNKTYLPWLSPNGGQNNLFAQLLSPEIADSSSYYGIFVGTVNRIVRVGGGVPSDAASRCVEEGCTRTKSRNIGPEFETATFGGLIGTTVQSSIFGRNLDLVLNIQDQTGGITPTMTQSSLNRIDADFQIDPGAAVGNHTIGMTSQSLGNPVTFTFYVQRPDSLTVISYPVSSSYLHDCMGTDWGVTLAVTYQVMDQETPNPRPIASAQMRPQEEIYPFLFNGTEDPQQEHRSWVDIYAPFHPGSTLYTTNDGQFLDAPYGVCGTGVATWNWTQYISMNIGGVNWPVRTNNIVEHFTSPGHGDITNNKDFAGSR